MKELTQEKHEKFRLIRRDKKGKTKKKKEICNKCFLYKVH